MINNRLILYYALFIQFQIIAIATANANDQLLYVISSQARIKTNDNSSIKTDTNLFGKFFIIESRNSLYYNCRNPSYGKIKFPLQQNNIDYLTTPLASNSIYASKVPGSNISQKIVFIVTSHSKNAYGEKAEKLPLFDNSMMLGKPIDFIEAHQLYFAYSFAKTDKAILVGKSNRFTKKSSNKILIGWIRRDNIAMWNNRMAIEFNKLNFQERKKCGLGKIYYSQSALTRRNSNDIFIEEEGTDKYLPHYARRFPVLDVSNNGEMIKTVATKVYDSMIKTKQELELKKTRKLVNYNISIMGYVNKYNQCKQKQIAVRVLMKKEEIELLKTALQRLANHLVYFIPDSFDIFDDAIYRLVKSLTGETINQNENISSFITKMNLLPFKTKLLNKSIYELKNEIQYNRAKRMNLAKYLRERVLKLEEVSREKMIYIEKWDDHIQTFEWESTNNNIPYFFSINHPYSSQDKLDNFKKRYAWVPLEYFP